MKRYDHQAIEIEVPFDRAFAFFSDNRQLPRWTNAFARVDGDRALLRTPSGEVTVTLTSDASADTGVIDGTLAFPDGTVLATHSRLVGDDRHCVYSFLLPAPPPALEALEGDLESQSEILAEELRRARTILEAEHAANLAGEGGA